MGIFTRKKEINGEFGNLIKKIEKWKNISLVEVKDSNDIFKITLREKRPYPKRKYPRLFVLSGSSKNENYSISSFEIYNSTNNPEKFSKIHTLDVEGNHNVKLILAELKEIIRGKDNNKIIPKFTF
jgi:hypothetical protein